MHTTGKYIGAGRSLDGDLTITLAIPDEQYESLQKLVDTELVIDIKKYNPKRSLNANAYFWKLCDLIAKKLGSNKDVIYLMQLEKYGVFVDVKVLRDALPLLKQNYRYVQEFEDNDGEYITARCYIGSSQYDTREMSELINGTVNDAVDLGCEVWSEAEINNLLRGWKNEQVQE